MGEASRTKKTLVNSIAGILNKFCRIILNFVLRTVFIYTLGIQYTGVSSVFTDILTMLSLTELGIGTAISTALYKPLYEKDEGTIQRLMSFYRMAYRYIAVMVLLIGFGLLPFLDRIITNVPDITENIKVIFLLFIIKNASSYLLIYKSTLLLADQKQYIVNTIDACCLTVRYIIEIICLIVFKDYMTYLIVEIIATISQNYIVTKRAEKEYPYAFKRTGASLAKKQRYALFKDIKGLAMFQISGSVGNSIDNILVSSFIGTALAGVLSNYYLIRKNIETLIKQFYIAVIPSLGNLAAEGDVEKQYVIFNRILYLSFLVVNFCAASMFSLFEPFISLWLGQKYTLGHAIAFVIAFDCFLYILLQSIASFRTANGLFVKGQYRPLITAVLNIVFSVVLIRKYGIIGTIIATIICRIITQWYDPYLLYRYVFKKKFASFYFKYLKYISIFLTECLAMYTLERVFTIDNSLVVLFLRIILCILFPNLWAILWTFRMEEFIFIKDSVLRIMAKKMRG